MHTTPPSSSHRPTPDGRASSDEDRARIDTGGRPPTTAARALVLGGGGSAGNAWLIGVVAGLVDAGLDVTDADLVVGTSAGATAAAQLGGAPPGDLLAAVLSAAPPQGNGPTGAGGRPRSAAQGNGPAGAGGRPESAADHMERTRRIIDAAEDAADLRRRLGAAALGLEAASDGSWSARWRATVAARLTDARWPEHRILVTAVDARTGDPVVFDRHTGVDLVDAVAASTSSGAPYAIGEDRYIDGGYRRNENADLAAGHERVLVLSPLGGRTRTPLAWGQQLATQVEELRAAGSRVETILPDADSLAAFGDTMMDLSTRPAAARAGHAQGRALAGRIAELWR